MNPFLDYTKVADFVPAFSHETKANKPQSTEPKGSKKFQQYANMIPSISL